MSFFVGRQPILDRTQRTDGYELFFRDSSKNFYDCNDGDRASLSVINTSFFHIGIDKLTSGKRAFINFTRYLLLHNFADVLPPDKVVIEILETVEPDENIIEACYRLKNAGYVLALDDFTGMNDRDELISIVDIIKVDLFRTTVEKRQEIAEAILPMNITLLAEKVETEEEFNQCMEFGYSFFQGYFFSKPRVIESTQPSESKVERIRLLKEVTNPFLNMEQAEDIIKHSPTLMVKLFRYINSAAFGMRNEVKSVKQALLLLGPKNLRKWVTILVLSGFMENKPQELMRQTIVRARFCELLAEPAGFVNLDQELFITGMFSLLDAILDTPMEQALEDLPISAEIKKALLDKSGELSQLIEFVCACEEADWEKMQGLAKNSNLDIECISELQQEAIEWADSLFREI